MTRKLRVAFFTPLSPVRSGIADYSEELLPDLARQCDVDAIINQYAPSNAPALAPARVKSLKQYAFDASRYDAHVYQIGNNVRHHGYILPMIEQVPGLLVLHDYCLHYLILGSTLARGDLRALEHRLSTQYGKAARRLTWQLLLSARDPFTLSFAGSLIKASSMILVHSTYARDVVLADHPGAIVRVVPMGIRASPCPSHERAAELRARFGLASGETIVASVSTPSYTKRLDLLVRSFRRALTSQPNLRLLILGGGLVQRPVRAEIGRGPVGDKRITHTGWLSGQDYRDLIALSDMVVDLRYPAAAETSASLLRALVAGKPAVIADHGPFSELPPSCCIRVAVDDAEEINVAAAISQLASDEIKRINMGNAAREYSANRCAPIQTARAYGDCIAEHVERRASATKHRVSPVMNQSTSRALVSGVYKAFRVGHLWRTYGSSVVWRRIREEVSHDV